MFGKLTVAKRLILGFGAFFLLLLCASGLALSRLAALDEMIERIVAREWQKVALANEAAGIMNANARETFLLFHVTDRATVQRRVADNARGVEARLDALEKLIYRPEGKALLADIRDRRKPYVAAFSNVARLLDAGKEAEASRLMAGETVPALDSLLGAADKLIKFQSKIMEETGEAAHAAYAGARNALMAFLALAALVGAAVATWIIRAVTRPLGGEPDAVKAVVQRVAKGNLSAQIEVKAGDSDSLIAAVSGMQESLRAMVGELKAGADGVAAAAAQLAASSSQVSAATAHQSEAAAAMAASVEQMTVSISHVSDSAHEAHAVTADAGGLSQEGKGIIQDTVSEMRRISGTVGEAARTIQAMGDSSQKISGIVQVIKDVAEQTNLLALNAAIEAARAGEQGRGFAVVADEVRKLAERTAQATAEISGMIGAVQASAEAAVGTMEQAVTQVEQGVRMAEAAGSSMVGISDGAQRVVAAVNEISNALKEQSAASNEIAANVEKIAQMSEENSAATREAADTAQQLERLAAQTRAAVSVFQL